MIFDEQQIHDLRDYIHITQTAINKAMPPSIPSPKRKVKLEHLTQDAFAQFGTVIQNPAHASVRQTTQPPKVVEANQGSALKYIDVSYLTNHYGSATSGRPAKSVVNMFVCKPRKLRSRKASAAMVTDQVVGSEMEHVFDVRGDSVRVTSEPV